MERYAALYCRCSSTDQHLEVQEAALRDYAKARGWTVRKVYKDHGISGVRTSRPGLDQLLTDCRRRKEKIDVVLVWKFDRFSRSLRHLATSLEELRRLRIDFCSATEAIDTSLPHGELVFQILGAIAQWERSLIAERVSAGLENARRRGKTLGRPPLRQLTTAEARELKLARMRQKTPFRQLARKFGVSVWTAHKLCSR